MVVGTKVQVRCHRAGGGDDLMEVRTVARVTFRLIVLDDGSKWNHRTLHPYGATPTRGLGLHFEPRLVEVKS